MNFLRRKSLALTPFQRRALQELKFRVSDTLDIDNILVFILARGDLSKDQIFALKRVKSKQERCVQFIETIQSVDNGWKILRRALKHVKQTYLSDELDALCKTLESEYCNVNAYSPPIESSSHDNVNAHPPQNDSSSGMLFKVQLMINAINMYNFR